MSTCSRRAASAAPRWIEGENVTTLCDFHLAAGHGVTAAAQARDRKIRFTLAQDAPLGPVPFRIATAQGGTGSRAFVVGQYRELLEREPGLRSTEAAHVTLPVTINGRIQADGDVDRYRVDLKAGELFSAEVMAARLGGPIDTNVFSGQFGNPPSDIACSILDASLRVLGPDGRLVADAEDTFGADPALEFTAPKDGSYVVVLNHLANLGMPQFVYRLTLSHSPLAYHAMPELPAGMSEQAEQEPNETAAAATGVALPGALAGGFARPGDVDTYRFSLRKGENWRFEAWSQRLGSPTDATLALLDPAGKMLANNDDGAAGTRDPALFFTVPADGEYLLQIQDAGGSRLGDRRLRYRIEAAPQPPEFRAELATEFLDLGTGKGGDVDVSLTRLGGFAGTVTVSAEGLPEGVAVKPLELNANQPKGKLHFDVAAGAPAGSAEVRVIATGTVGEQSVRQTVPCRAANPAEPAVQSCPVQRDTLLLTVRFPSPFKLESDDYYNFVNLGCIFPSKQFIDRSAGFTAPIRLSAADRQPRNPYGVRFEPMTVTDLGREILFPMYLPQGPRGNEIIRIHVKGEAVTHDARGREWHVLVTSAKNVVCRTQAPILSLVAEPDVLRQKPGTEVQVRFRLGRTPQSTGAAEIRLESGEGMRGVSMDPVTVPAGATEAVGTVRIAADADGGRTNLIGFQVFSKRDTGLTIFYRTQTELDLRR
jgi:hypothetical protein